MIKTLTLIAFSFIVSASVYAEVEKRAYSQGALFIEYVKFIKENKTKKEITSLEMCGTCPGTDGFLPNTEIKNIRLVVRNDKFSLPTELTAGLYNPHIGSKFFKKAFSIKETKLGVMATISGGDGSASYNAEFNINLIDMQVERKIYQHPNREKPEVKIGNIIYKGKAP